MKHRLHSAFALIGLMLFSTLGSMAFSPGPSTTKTEYGLTAKISKTSHVFVDVTFVKPADLWKSAECARYADLVSDRKYDNKPINGILEEQKRQAGNRFLK
jgi:hypothetical protein